MFDEAAAESAEVISSVSESSNAAAGGTGAGIFAFSTLFATARTAGMSSLWHLIDVA